MIAVLLAVPGQSWADDAKDAKTLVSKAQSTVENFLKDPDMKWFGDRLRKAKGVYIVSKRLKGAFIFGVEDGNGVFLSRNETTGAWSEPAFFEMSSASFGLQAGAQSQEAVLLVISPKEVESILTGTVKLGVDGSVAVGPKGMGAEGSTAPNLSADFVTFPHAKGLYAGLALDGAMIRTRDELNAAFYGEKVRPTDILVTQKVKHNQASKGLQATLTEAVAAK